jgi:hypothetical protein
MKERSFKEESESANVVDAERAAAAEARKVKEWLVEVVVVVSLARVAEAKVERPVEDAQAAPGGKEIVGVSESNNWL